MLNKGLQAEHKCEVNIVRRQWLICFGYKIMNEYK